MVVDALLMCFCEDSSINDGSPGREYFMSTSLKVCVGFNGPFGFAIFFGSVGVCLYWAGIFFYLER